MRNVLDLQQDAIVILESDSSGASSDSKEVKTVIPEAENTAPKILFSNKKS